MPQLAADAESLVAAAETAVARARELGGAPPQTLLLGVSPGVGQGELERILDALGGALPGVQLDLLETRPAAVGPQLRDGTADLVLARFAQAGPAATCCRWAPARPPGSPSRTTTASPAGGAR